MTLLSQIYEFGTTRYKGRNKKPTSSKLPKYDLKRKKNIHMMRSPMSFQLKWSGMMMKTAPHNWNPEGPEAH